MASYRRMRDFVEYVSGTNTTLKKSYGDILKIQDWVEVVQWVERNVAIDEYAKKFHLSEEEANQVYQDTVYFKYIRPHNVDLPNQDKRLIVTEKGRHFLRKVKKVKWGYWVDVTKDSNALLTLILGVVLSSVFWVVLAIAGGFVIRLVDTIIN